MFSESSRIKKQTKKNVTHIPNTWKLNSMLLHNSWVKENINGKLGNIWNWIKMEILPSTICRMQLDHIIRNKFVAVNIVLKKKGKLNLKNRKEKTRN